MLVVVVAGWLSSARERAASATAAVAAGEDEARLLVNEVQDYAIFKLDPDGYVATWNKGAERIKGYRSEEILGKHFSCFWPEEDVEAGRPQQALAAAAKEGRYEVQGARIRKDGSTFIAHVVVTSLYERTGRLCGFSKVTRDITDAVRAEEERERLYERERASRLRAERGERRASFLADIGRLLEETSLDYERTLERVAGLAVPQVCDWALVEMLQEDGSIKRLAMAHADPAKEALLRDYDRRFPLDPEAPEGSPKVIRTGHPELMADEALEAVAQDSEHLRFLRELGSRSAMIVPLRARGQTIGDLALVSGESGRRYDQDDLAMATDLAGRCGLALDNARLHKEALEREADHQHQALHDALTRLPNRTLFLDRLGQALARSGRHVGGPALFFADLDGFKDVNDTHGHATGDELLAQVADRLAQVVRPEDTVSRFGGDEFTILCESIMSRRDAVTVAERIIACLEKSFAIGGRELSIAVSIGVVFARGCDETPESLIRDGDAAMYRAKQQGPGRYQVFEQHTSVKALDRLTTESGLRRSAEGEGFGVAYQPIVDLRTSTVVGAEALSRWDHPKRGFLEARDYIALAEETGLSLSVDALVLDSACRQAARWKAENLAAPPLVVFVNVSVKDLHQPEFIELVEEALSRTATDPATLCLEIKDSTFLNRSHPTIGSLLALKGLGLRLAIDDFGKGYASLSYRRRFPIDYLKLDASIVAGIAFRPAHSALIAATTNMAHALGLTLIAKGVENRQQLTALSDLGCDQAQGYHLAPPQRPGQLEGALSSSRGLDLQSSP